MRSSVFGESKQWPTVILALSGLVDIEGYSNPGIEVSKYAVVGQSLRATLNRDTLLLLFYAIHS